MGVSLSKAGEAIGGFVGEAGKKLGGWVSDTVGKAGEVAKGLADKLGGLGSKAAEWGGNVMDGLKNGINGGINAVKETAGKVASSVSGFFKNILGIHSPSKVFAEFGRFIDEGLAVGISRNADLALAPMEDLAQSLEQAITPNINYPDFDDADFNTNASGGLNALIEKDYTSQTIVYVGDDKLVDTVVDGANTKASLQNRNVFYV
jgi:hypothetical protein